MKRRRRCSVRCSPAAGATARRPPAFPRCWGAIVGHLCDNERVFAYRALRFARGDPTPIANFDENLYVQTGRFDLRPLTQLLDELRLIRSATLALFRTFDADALLRSGIARGLRTSVRAMVWVTVEHMRHHFAVLRERYGISNAVM